MNLYNIRNSNRHSQTGVWEQGRKYNIFHYFGREVNHYER